jgi:hypothetical protein
MIVNDVPGTKTSEETSNALTCEADLVAIPFLAGTGEFAGILADWESCGVTEASDNSNSGEQTK